MVIVGDYEKNSGGQKAIRKNDKLHKNIQKH